MDDIPAGSLIVVLLALLILDGVVYGFGSALRSIRIPSDADRNPDDNEDKNDGETTLSPRERKRRRLIARILRDKAAYVDTVQLVTACVNMIVGAVYGVTFSGYVIRLLQALLPQNALRPLLVVIFVVIGWLFILFIVLVFGVQIPKRLGNAHPEGWVQRCGPVFRVLMVVTLPLTRLVSVTARGILYLFGVRGQPLQSDVTEDEIRSMLSEGHEQGVIDQSEAEMITNIFEFSDKEASDIMTPRGDLVMIDAEQGLGDAISFMLEQHNSRFPVYEENIDNIIGVLHFRDAIRYREENPGDEEAALRQCEGLIRDAEFIPETRNIDDLFRQMQKEKIQMVIVVDEYGQTSGLIAMEDILEEIVGNIMDEYDVDENHITATANKNEFIIDGRTPLEDLTERFGIVFEDERFETVNGFLMSQMDRVPDSNEHFTTDYGGFRFHIISVADRQVQRCSLTRITDET